MVEKFKKYSFFIVIGLFIIVFFAITREKEEMNQDLTPIEASNEGEGMQDNHTELNGPVEEVFVDIKGEIK